MPKPKIILGLTLAGLALFAGVVVHWVWLVILGLLALLVFASSSEASSFRFLKVRSMPDEVPLGRTQLGSPTSIKHYIRKDLVWSVAFAVLWIILGAGGMNPLSFFSGSLSLFLISVLAIWWNERTIEKTGMTRTIVPRVVGFSRWLHVLGIVYGLGALVIGFNHHLLSTVVESPQLGAALLLSFIRLGLTYKALSDWSLSLRTTNRVNLKDHRRLILIILALSLLGELLIWGRYN